MNKTDEKARTAALGKLTKAQHMIKAGRQELAAALRKIEAAQQMIDESTSVISETWKRREG